MTSWLCVGLALVLAPLLPGVAQRTKSWLTGRRGPPVLQLYWDLARLWRKGAVFSSVTGASFRLGPVVFAASTVAAAMLLPFANNPALIRFPGDFVAFAGVLALGRFALVLAALDTGSSFEGMGASREAAFGSLSEPVLVLCFAALALASQELSLSGMLGPALPSWWAAGPALAMVGAGVFLVTLAETGRVPVDDPATHLELTMIHEVMVLDHSGPDFALIHYAAALKLTLLGTLLAGVLVPAGQAAAVVRIAGWLGGLLALAVAIGVVESVMARLRLARVPQLLTSAAVLPGFAILLLLSRAA